MRNNLEQFIGLGGLTISESTTPWAGAYRAGTVATPEAARTALDAVGTLADHTLPQAQARVMAAVGERGLSLPETIEGWQQALALLEGVTATLARFDPAIFDQPLDDLAAALGPAEKGVARSDEMARLTNASYRHTLKTVRSFLRGERLDARKLHDAVIAATARSGGGCR